MFEELQHTLKTPLSGRFSFHQWIMLAAMVLLWLSWLMPLHFLPWVSWHSEAMAFLSAFLLAGYGLFRLFRRERAPGLRLPWAALPLALLGMLALVQGVTGQITFGGDVAVLCLYMALCVMCIILGFHAVGPEHAGSASAARFLEAPPLILLAAVLVAGGFASTIVALVQCFDIWQFSGLIVRMPELRHPGGNLGQPNQLATLLWMSVASLLFLYESGRLKSATTALIFVVFCIGIAATESRTGLLNFLVLLGWWFCKRPQVRFRLSPWVILGWSAGFLLLFWSWPPVVEFMQNMPSTAVVDTDAGIRPAVWKQLLEAIQLRPWFGWGLGSVSEAHNHVLHAYEVGAPFSYGHNILLDLAIGAGVPLTIFLVLVSGVWLWRKVRATANLLPWYCIAMILPVAVHSMLEFPFAYAYFLVPVMFALGALEALVPGRAALTISGRAVAALFLGLSVLAAYSVAEYATIEEDFRIARFEAIRMGQTPADYQRPEVRVLTQLGALLEAARIKPRAGMGAEELTLARNAALRYPWPATQNRYALSLALNGDTAEAIRQMRVMKAMHGEKTYAIIKANWGVLAQDKHPQLRTLTLP